jgi:hypothetical protein
MIYALRFQRPFEKMAAWSQGRERFKRAWHPLRWQIPLRNTRCEEFPAHGRHTVGVERKDMADVLPQGTEQVEFRRIEVEGMPDSRSARLNRQQKKLTNLLIFIFPSIALIVEGLWAHDKPDWTKPLRGTR